MKYLVLGSKGQLGKEFVKYFTKVEAEYKAFDIDEIDISNRDMVFQLCQSFKPNVIINCAAYNLVDNAETNPDEAYKSNSKGVENLAIISNETGSNLVHYSTDYVFDGKKETGLYTEQDEPNPLSVYAKSKYDGEMKIKENTDNYLILRLSWVFGDGQQNFIYKLLQWAEKNNILKIAFDEVSVPTYTHTIVEATLKALSNQLKGLYHLTNSGYASRYEWAKYIIKKLNKKNILYPVSKDIFNLPAKRPGFSAMSNELLSNTIKIEIPFWEKAVDDYLSKYL
ncbi:MAG: dTDP-4-dehydrorhamnose reductase [Candidatus Kapabacteria bacterium]|nr:dTDP-4-dehydrorhamnose reductase [Candidatus Kapabacteria bacterium]